MSEKSPDELTAGMLRQELFVVTTTPARSPQIRAMLPEHLDYQVQLEREGKLFGAGPLYEQHSDVPYAGMIILRAANLEEARAIANADPFHKAGLRSYTINKWLLNEGSMTVTVRYSDRSAVIARSAHDTSDQP
jgi:uncharacterized protein